MSIALVSSSVGFLGVKGLPHPKIGIVPVWDAAAETLGLLFSMGTVKNVLTTPAIYSDYTLDGVACTSFAQLVTFGESAFFLTSGGGAAFEATELTGDAWDGTHRYIETLTTDRSLTLTTTRTTGTLTVTQSNGGGNTLEINGQAIPIDATPLITSVITFFEVNGFRRYKVDVPEVEELIPIPDTTAPTIVSVEATGPQTIIVTFSEEVVTLSGNPNLGFSFNNGAALTVGGVSINSSTERGIDIDEVLTNADVITYAYSATTGQFRDAAGNALANDSGNVINSIVDLGTLLEDESMATDPGSRGWSLYPGAGTPDFTSGDLHLSGTNGAATAICYKGSPFESGSVTIGPGGDEVTIEFDVTAITSGVVSLSFGLNNGSQNVNTFNSTGHKSVTIDTTVAGTSDTYLMFGAGGVFATGDGHIANVKVYKS